MFTRINIQLSFDTVEEMNRAYAKLEPMFDEDVSHFFGVDMCLDWLESYEEAHEIAIVAEMEKTPDKDDAFVVHVYSRFELGASHVNAEYDCIEGGVYFTLKDEGEEIALRSIPAEHFPKFENDDPFDDPECREKVDQAYEEHATREVIATDDGYTIRRAV